MLLCPGPRAIHSHSVISACGSTQTGIYGDTLFPWHWRSNEHIWQFRKTSSHSFRDTDDPTNIYGNSGKLRHILSATLTIQRTYMAIRENFVTSFPRHWRSNEHIWQFGKTSSHSFCDTDDPTSIYGNSGKLRHILSATLTIQRTYMVDLGYYRELSCYARTCKVYFHFLSHILVKWRSNETIASVGLAQARPNYTKCLVLKILQGWFSLSNWQVLAFFAAARSGWSPVLSCQLYTHSNYHLLHHCLLRVVSLIGKKLLIDLEVLVFSRLITFIAKTKPLFHEWVVYIQYPVSNTAWIHYHGLILVFTLCMLHTWLPCDIL